MMGSTIKGLWRGGLGALACVLVCAAPALANAPNPETTTVDQVLVNPDGSTTVTVQGTWTWQTQTKCATARNGVGYQIDWFDNQTNAIGTANDPLGVLYVGDAQDNVVHSVETLGGSSAVGNAFYDGVPSSYIAHLKTTGTTPTATDAKNWLSQCPNVNSSGVTAGTWGPITHTYLSTAAQPLQLCPVMYDPHGGHDNSGQSSVQDITAGGNAATKNYNSDNSYQTNQFTGGPGTCSTITIPSMKTNAASANRTSGSVSDTATLSNTGGQSGSIVFNLYAASAGCKGAPLYTKTVPTNGDGTYGSGAFAPGSPGTYQWQDSYSSSTVKGLLSSCTDKAEQSTVPPPMGPAIVTQVPAASASLGDAIFDQATLSGGVSPTGTITWKLYDDAACIHLVDTASVSVHGNGTYTASPTYMVTSPGIYSWVASYSGDANNNSASTSCGDRNEETTVLPNQPAIVTDATPSAVVGDTITDQATLSGGYRPTGTITWRLYSDSGCTNLVDTVSVPVNGNGSYATSPGYTANNAGTYFWVASYSGDADNNPVSTSCGDPNEETPVSTPGIAVRKLASVPCSDVASSGVSQPPGVLPCTGFSTIFTPGTITVEVPTTGRYSIPITYEIQVTNTGTTTLALSLNDPHCDPGTVTGPFLVSGQLTGTTLSAGGRAVYKCTHNLVPSDGTSRFSAFTNTATVTGTPPIGPPVQGSGIVTTNRVHPSPARFCRSLRTGRKVRWRFHHRKPRACRPQRGQPGKGFTA